MISCVGQSAQVPANPHAAGQQPVEQLENASYTSYGGSPSGRSSSGYASAGHGSPSSEFGTFESMLDGAELAGVKLEEPQLQLLSEVSPWTPHPPPSHFAYQQHKPELLDPMCAAAAAPPYGCYSDGPKYFGNGAPPYPPYGSIAGSNFSYCNYPQTTEETASPLGLSPPPGSNQTLCRVCGDTASGNHFGVLSCEACKSFFRRSVRAGAHYACRGSRTCAIEKHTRNRCQYCRLQKCMDTGMRKEGTCVSEGVCECVNRKRGHLSLCVGFS